MRTVLYFLPSTIIGGAETQLIELLKKLDHSRWKSVIVTVETSLNSGYYRELTKYGKIETATTDHRLAQLISYYKPDIIQHFHNHMLSQALDQCAHRARVIEVVHGCIEFPGHVASTPKHWTTHVVAVSADARDYFLSRVPSFAKKTSVITNGVDVGRFYPSPKLTNLGFNPEFIEILHCGRLCEGDKQYGKMFDALAALPDKRWNFVCVGTGFDLPQIHRELVRSGQTPRARFPGFTDKPEQYYQNAHIYMSRSPSEGFGLSIAEAAASGLPINLWDCGGVARFFTHGLNALISKTDEEFIKNLQLLYKDKLLRSELGREARKLAFEQFSTDKMAAEYTALYDQLLSNPTIEVSAPAVPSRLVGIANPHFHGVTSAVRNWVGRENLLAVLPGNSPNAIVNSVLAKQPEVVIFGGDSGYLPIARAIKNQRPSTKLLLTWHANFSFLSFAPGDAGILFEWIRALDQHVIDGIGFVGLGQAEIVRHPRAMWFPNTVPSKEPFKHVKPTNHGPGVHIGVFNSGYAWKNSTAQILAAGTIPGATVHIGRISEPEGLLIRRLVPKLVMHGHMEQSRFHSVIAGMTATMQVTHTESFGLTFCESYRLGVPCLGGPSMRHLALDYPDTFVEDADNAQNLARSLKDLIEAKTAAVKAVNDDLDNLSTLHNAAIRRALSSI